MTSPQRSLLPTRGNDRKTIFHVYRVWRTTPTVRATLVLPLLASLPLRSIPFLPSYLKQHFLYLTPLPQWHGSFRPRFMRLTSREYWERASRTLDTGFMSAVNRSISSEVSHGKFNVTPNWTCPAGLTEPPNHCAARCWYLRVAQCFSNTAIASGDGVGLQWKLIPQGGVLNARVKSCGLPSICAFLVMSSSTQWTSLHESSSSESK